MAVLGNAIALTGALVRTVADAAEIDWHLDLQLGDEATLGSTAGILNLKEAAVSGGDLTKTGAGTVSLRDASSYTGKTVVEAGTLHFNADGALPAGSSVSIAAGATVDVDPMGKATTALRQRLQRARGGYPAVQLRHPDAHRRLLRLRRRHGGGDRRHRHRLARRHDQREERRERLRHGRRHGRHHGLAEHARGRDLRDLDPDGVLLDGGGTGFGITDAAGDPGVGFDQLPITGDVDIPAVVDGKGGLMVVPMSIDGTGASGSCANFDPTRSYRWPVVHVDGQVNGFDPAAGVGLR